jgi:hypothetical protein
MQGYNVLTAPAERRAITSYDSCLTRLLSGMLERPDQKEGYIPNTLKKIFTCCLFNLLIYCAAQLCKCEN